MDYGDYMATVARLAVELANAGGLDGLSASSRELMAEHGVDIAAPSAPADLADLATLVSAALGQIVDAAEPAAVHELLRRHPPDMHLSDHDGTLHVHFGRDGAPPERWLGQLIGAKLALLATGDPAVTLGRCAAIGCAAYFLDQSRNRTRRFCGNACASRTTVAAHRARQARS